MADSQENLLLKIKEQGELVRKLKAAKESNEKVSTFNYSNCNTLGCNVVNFL